MKPTVDEQELAYKIASRIDGAEYRQRFGSNSSKLRVTGLMSIVVDEIMQFRLKQVPVSRSKEEEHF